ncbi:MAG: 7-carboxy-7-deazaguanine synthase QueE [Candidatus Ancaeobacter aquaticus]|nr:7-carboxy-7-deazaguanine synthase QueE [Candidatus Ancaeobacter aquaticus]
MEKEIKGKIVEIFHSIQGEGKYVGQRHIFVRLAGCNIGACSYCDTDYAAQSEMTAEEVVKNILLLRKKEDIRTISVTGGEPLVQDEFLENVLKLLSSEGVKILLETNGTMPEAFERIKTYVDIVSIDIKLPSSCSGKSYWSQHTEFLQRASEKDLYIKVVVGKETEGKEFSRAIDCVRKIDKAIPFFIQPESDIDGKCRITEEKLVDLFKLANKSLLEVRVMPQIHKILNVP